MIRRIIEKSLNGEDLGAEEIAGLFEIPLFSPESALLLSAARKKSDRASGGLAEVHAQVGLNIAPCPRNCLFCAFAARNKVFREKINLPLEEVLAFARQFESDDANAVLLMATADYPMAKYLEYAREVRKSLRPETVLIANVGDFTRREAQELRDAGFTGIYHALRLGEGRDTTIPPEKRIETLRNAREAGLTVGTCVEPVGPEHTVRELVEKTLITREARPGYSGSARRVPIPDTQLAKHGMVSQAKMAHLLAVVRLALGYDVPGNCVHEPSVIGAAAGANLLWAEKGSNPRDTEKETEGKRGMTVAECARVLEEAEWEVLSGPSRFYRARV